jgi:hypothetical protein
MPRSRKHLHAAATVRQRLRVRRVVAERGDGYSWTCRNVWVRIEIPAASVRSTASTKSSLGTMPEDGDGPDLYGSNELVRDSGSGPRR